MELSRDEDDKNRRKLHRGCETEKSSRKLKEKRKSFSRVADK